MGLWHINLANGAAGKVVAACSWYVQQPRMGQRQIKPYHKAPLPVKQHMNEPLGKSSARLPAKALRTSMEESRRHLIYCPAPKGASSNPSQPGCSLVTARARSIPAKFYLGHLQTSSRAINPPDRHTQSAAGARVQLLHPPASFGTGERASETEPSSLWAIKCWSNPTIS